MVKFTDLLKYNFPINIRVNFNGAGVVDFNVSCLGWMADPEFNVRPAYGSEDHSTEEHLRNSIVRVLSQVAFVPKDNIEIPSIDMSEEIENYNKFIKDIKDNKVTLPNLTYISKSGIVVTIVFSIVH